MDCQQALDILDVTFPGSDNPSDPEFASATTHLDECPRCAVRFQHRQELDRTIGLAMRDIPVPAELKQNLLDQLRSTDSASEPTPGSAVTPIPAASSRRRLRILFSLSACIAAGFAFWWFFSFGTSSHLTLTELQAELQTIQYDPQSLPAFDGNFKASLPSNGWSRFVGPAHGFYQDERGKHLVALHEFQFTGPGGTPVAGILLILPKSLVEDVPTSTFFNPNHASYTPVPNMAWNRGELVYVCLIPKGDPEMLELLSQALHGGLA